MKFTKREHWNRQQEMEQNIDTKIDECKGLKWQQRRNEPTKDRNGNRTKMAGPKCHRLYAADITYTYIRGNEIENPYSQNSKILITFSLIFWEIN